jgi:hypothetical protein
MGTSRMRRIALATLMLTSIPLGAMAAPAPDPVVVELFTSQGCSSCPPADAFLTELAQQRKDVLPLSFHVTYWNGLGWKDPYSFDAATERQQQYARSLGDRQVYTPEMVVNGEQGFVGSDRAEGLAEIARAAHDRGIPVPLRLTRKENGLSVSIGAGTGDATVLLVGFDPEHRTAVGRGENGGRTLLESNIVRSLSEVGQWTGAAVDLQAAIPAGERLAVLLQSNEGKILAAATLDTPDL